MKKLLLIIFLIYSFKLANCQDITNWYKDWAGLDASNLSSMVYPLISNTMQPGYDGEYVILASDMPWVQARLTPVLANYVLNNMYFTYQTEIVSFPFSPECAFIGCANTTNRDLKMPDDGSYSALDNAWEYSGANPLLYNITYEQLFQDFGNGDWISSQSMPYTLASGSFGNLNPYPLDRIVLPHTILKHTLRLRCAPSFSSPVLTSIVFYTDLTRGSMREYPFIPTNFGNSARTHDVIIKPGLYNDYANYAATSTCGYGEWLIGSTCTDGTVGWIGDVINYTPFDITDDDNICSGFPSGFLVNLPSDASFYYSNIDPPIQYDRLPISNHSLVVSTGVRDWESIAPAGFYYAGNVGTTLTRIEPNYFQHEYYIDKNIDLNKINSTDRVIFNPSEVHVTAPDLIFPTNYTFKTISGRYPYLPEVMSQNTIKNGGPYNTTDPNDPNYIVNLNTETDLYKDFHVSSAYPSNIHMYSSIYHLDNGGKISIEPCVRIFDATFEINSGSEIVFENWSTNKINDERYQLLYEGGIVTRCDEDIFCQSENETKKILHWKAGNSIRAGENVTVDDVPGVYKLFSGSEVSFIANNFISLETGFDSESGSFLDAHIEPISIPSCGPLRVGRREVNASHSNSKETALSYFECSPNPINANSVCMFKIGNTSNVTLLVYNSLGQLIATICEEKQLPAGSYTYNLNKSDFMSGIYYAKLNVNDDSRSLKFIKP